MRNGVSVNDGDGDGGGDDGGVGDDDLERVETVVVLSVEVFRILSSIIPTRSAVLRNDN